MVLHFLTCTRLFVQVRLILLFLWSGSFTRGAADCAMFHYGNAPPSLLSSDTLRCNVVWSIYISALLLWGSAMLSSERPAVTSSKGCRHLAIPSGLPQVQPLFALLGKDERCSIVSKRQSGPYNRYKVPLGTKLTLSSMKNQ